MKVAIALTQFPKLSETFIVNKVEGLLARGVDVQIYTARRSRDWDRFPALDRPELRARVHEGAGTNPLAMVAAAVAALRRPLLLGRFVLHAWRARRDDGLGFLRGVLLRLHWVAAAPDVLHVEFEAQALGVADLGAHLRCPVVISCRNTLERTSVPARWPDIRARLSRQADGYHFIAAYLRAESQRLGLDPRLPTWLIPPAVPIPSQRPAPRPRSEDAPLNILAVSRIDHAKGLEFAMEAIALVRRSGTAVRFVVAGDGPYEEAVRFAALQLGLLDDGTVELLGAVPPSGVGALLAQADVFLHAAIEEGFSNAVLEAQAAGVPVVTTDAGGLPENVAHGETGLVVRRRDPVALADAIATLAADEAARSRMAAAGRERVARYFTLERQVDSFVAMYDELIAAGRRRRR